MTFPSPIVDQTGNYGVFLYPALGILFLNTLLYIIAQSCLKRDNSYIDIMWGFSFCVPIAIVWFIRINVYE